MSFTALHIGLSALRSQQLAQETTGQNVANVNTPGYTRREVRLVNVGPAEPYSPLPQPGLGVSVADIGRAADMLLNRQIGREQSNLTYWQNMCEGMSELQGLFQEPGERGLESLMNAFWSSWSDLANTDATDSAQRLNIRQTAEALAVHIRRTHTGIIDFASRQDGDLAVQVQQLNTLAAEVANVNKQICHALATGNAANDLCDQRDVLLEEISKLARVQSAQNADGSTTVMLDGHILVGTVGAEPLTIHTGADGTKQPVWSDSGLPVTVREGEIGQTMDLRAWALQEVLPELNKLAAELINAVNDLHEGAYTLDDRTGVSFFAGTDAHDIQLSTDVIASLDAIATAAVPDAHGDGSVALQIAALQQAHVSALGDSIGGFYAAFVGKLGLDVQQADTMAKNQDALVRFLTNHRESLTGVSLDEEAVRMMGAQRAYEAAARVITTVDEMLDQLINRTGLVGR